MDAVQLGSSGLVKPVQSLVCPHMCSPMTCYAHTADQSCGTLHRWNEDSLSDVSLSALLRPVLTSLPRPCVAAVSFVE